MNNIINKFLSTADKCMPEAHLKDLKVATCSACGPFTQHKDRINKFIQTSDTHYIYKNELDKACFAHDVPYSDFKDTKNRTAADKILRDKAYEIAKDPKYYGSQKDLASMVYKFFDKRTSGSGVTMLTNKSAVKSIPQNEQLAEERHKPIIKKFKKRKVYSTFKNYTWAADLADMQLISKFNERFGFLLCVIDIYSKYAWVVPLKDKKGVRIANEFQKNFKQSARKPHKIWVDKGSEFYDSHFKK